MFASMKFGGILSIIFFISVIKNSHTRQLIITKQPTSESDNNVRVEKHLAWYDKDKQKIVSILQWDYPVSITGLRINGSLNCQNCEAQFNFTKESHEQDHFFINFEKSSFDKFSDYIVHFKDNGSIEAREISIKILIDKFSSINFVEVDEIEVMILQNKPNKTAVYEVTFYTADVKRGSSITAPSLILIGSENYNTTIDFSVKHFHQGSAITESAKGEIIDIKKIKYIHKDTDTWHIEKIEIRNGDIKYTCPFDTNMDLFVTYQKTVNCSKESKAEDCPLKRRKTLFEFPTTGVELSSPCQFPFLFEGRTYYNCAHDANTSRPVCSASCHLNNSTKMFCLRDKMSALPMTSMSISSSTKLGNKAQEVVNLLDKQKCVQFEVSAQSSLAYFVADMGRLQITSLIRLQFYRNNNSFSYPNLYLGRYISTDFKSGLKRCSQNTWSQSSVEGIDYRCPASKARFLHFISNSTFQICKVSIFKTDQPLDCLISARNLEVCKGGSSGQIKLFRKNSSWIGFLDSVRTIDAVSLTGISQLSRPGNKLLLYGKNGKNGTWTLCGDMVKTFHSYLLKDSGFMFCHKPITVTELKITHKGPEHSDLLKIWTVIYHEIYHNKTVGKGKVLPLNKPNDSRPLECAKFTVILSLFSFIIRF